jgi:hypothetical protein
MSHNSHRHRDTELAAQLHRGEQVVRAEKELRQLLLGLVSDAAASGDVRDDASPDELVTYCLFALTAASRLPSKAAVYRLVAITLVGLRPGD